MSKTISFLINTAFLIIAVLTSFYLVGNPGLSSFSVSLIGLLIIFYILNHFQKSSVNKLIDSLILTMVILLVVLNTGGLESPALFLIFILATFISLIHNPITATILITLIGILLNTDQLFLWLFIPIIISYISKQYLQSLEDQHKIKILETEEKILEKEVSKIETDVSTFSQEALNDLAKNDLKSLEKNIQSLPDKIDEETGL